MCSLGDIILVDAYKHAGRELSRHSFVVISNESGKIQGLDYNLVCNVLSSFKNDQQRAKKLGYPGNFGVTHNDTIIPKGNEKDGFVKAEQLYYFNTDKLNYIVIGSMRPEVFNNLLEFISNLDVPIVEFTDNL